MSLANTLIHEEQASRISPYWWTLSGTPAAEEGEANPWGKIDTDGYKLDAALGWVEVEANEDGSMPNGTLGACVEAIVDGANDASGNPAICHFITAEGNNLTSSKVVSLTAEKWNRGQMKITPAWLSAAATIANATNVIDYKVAETVVDEVTDDAFQADDDGGWADDAVDDAVDGADGAVDDAKDAEKDAEATTSDTLKDLINTGITAIKKFTKPITPGAKASWYQPPMSKTYTGLRRYGAGDTV